MAANPYAPPSANVEIEQGVECPAFAKAASPKPRGQL